MAEKREKFYDKIGNELSATISKLKEEHPELDGAVIGLVFDPALENIPQSRLLIGNTQDPVFVCRAGVQAARLQVFMGQGITTLFSNALAAAQQAEQQNDKRDRPTESPGQTET